MNTKEPIVITQDNLKVFVDGNEWNYKFTTGDSSIPLDLVFAIDSSSSMEPAINSIKESVTELVQFLNEKGLTVRVGGVDFADLVRTKFDLTNDISLFKDWLSKINTISGGDSPESGLDACVYINEAMGWAKGAQRVIILISNSTTHVKGEKSCNYLTPSSLRMTFLDAKYNLDDVKRKMTGNTIIHTVSRVPNWHWTSGMGSDSQGMGGGDGYSLGEIGSNVEIGLGINCADIADTTGGLQYEFCDDINLTKLPITDVMSKWCSVEITGFTADGKPHNIQLYLETEDGKSGMVNYIRYVFPNPVPFSALFEEDKNWVLYKHSRELLPAGLKNDNGVSMIPVRWFIDQFGAIFEYNKLDNKYSIQLGDKWLTFWSDKPDYYLDTRKPGGLQEKDTEQGTMIRQPRVENGSMLLPAGFLLDRFDIADYEWDEKNRRLIITYPKL
jgi:hypothetical protein